MGENRKAIDQLRRRIAAFLVRCTASQAVYHMSLSIAIFAVGLVLNIFLATRLNEARRQEAEVRTALDQLNEVQELMQQAAVFHDSLQEEADLVHWQDYVQGLLQEAGARLKTFSPGQTIPTANFKVLDLDVSATGDFAQLAGFIQRLEHSGELIRVDEFTMNEEDGVLSLDCKVRILTGTSNLDLFEREVGREEVVSP